MYQSIEGELHLSCRHDGTGTVSCEVTLRNPAAPEWSLEAVIEFGAGAHLERLSGEIDEFQHVNRGNGSDPNLARANRSECIARFDLELSLLCPYN
jgi:hypothetical protein